jgi:hypothetical protein
MLVLLLPFLLLCGAAVRAPPAASPEVPPKYVQQTDPQTGARYTLERADVGMRHRTLQDPLQLARHPATFGAGPSVCMHEVAMFRLPAQRGLLGRLQGALKTGAFQEACLDAALERAVLSHPVRVVKELVRAGARPTRALVAQVAQPRACDQWGIGLGITRPQTLAGQRRELWDALVAAEPQGLTEEDKGKWLMNIVLCNSEFWIEELYAKEWASVGDALDPAELGEGAADP